MCKNRQSRIGGNFEGDIFLTSTTVVRGIGKKDPSACWSNDAYDRAKIISAMRRLERVVSLNPTTASYCIRFRPKTSDDKHLTSIKNGSDCSSYACYIFTTDKTFILSFKVGRIFEGSQHLTLQMKSYCVDREAAIMHEFMRAFGFWHEQSRPDRDDYITIDFNNVQKGNKRF
ncbi:unnamed protein product [Rotaria magnacalcarata]|uniref:Metalloendopeptidase n=2 Tax=Rotaria magnacalcarata TaxID=392030 RepID=A0A819JJ49_9BILA|nr:unnamed protein product [Rotaria magnacalcarata]